MLKQLGRSALARAAGAELLGAYLRFALATTRWRIEGSDHLDRVIEDTPCVFAFWHERLALMSALWLLARRRRARAEPGTVAAMHVLISANRDGQLYGAIVRRMGARVVHGSRAKGRDQKGGAAGLRALLGVLNGGGQVALTPDGPRGPAHRAAPGVAQLAGLARVAVIPLSAQTSRRRHLPSWDRMVLPLPFGRGVLVCGAPVLVPREAWAASLPVIEAALNAAQSRADARC